MSKATIISIWAVIFLVLDCVTVFVPLGSFMLLVVVLVRPKWFLNAVHDLYALPRAQ
jgi:hypothetical protein